MTKNFIKKTAVTVITIVVMIVSTISAKGQPPCSNNNTGASVTCNVTNFWIGTDPNGNGNMCADFNITFTCNPNCVVTVNGSVTFYECGTGAGAVTVTYPFRGTENLSGVWWDFFINFRGTWIPIPRIFDGGLLPPLYPSVTVINAAGNSITCELYRIGLIPGATINNTIFGLSEYPAFEACYNALGCF